MSAVEVQPAVDSTGDAKPVTIEATKPNDVTENNNATNKQQMVDNGGAIMNNAKPGGGMKDLDELAPASKYWTVNGSEAVKLHMTSEGHGSEKPITVPSLFHKTVQRVPNNVAMAVKRGGVWVKWTYQQYYNSVKQAAKSFIKLGLEPYHGVGIIGFNSPEWFLSDLGAIFAGGFAVGIYTTNSPEACEFVAGNCEANIVVVENNQQLQKILKVWDNLPHLKAVIQYTGEVAERKPNVYNITWTALKLGQSLELKYGTEVCISYLPLSHVAAQLQDLYIPISFGGTSYFAAPDALKLTWTSGRLYEWLELKFGCETVVSYLPLSHIAGQVLDIINPILSGGPQTVSNPSAFKICSVGKEFYGATTKLVDVDGDGNGEVELIITAGGENIAPVPVEDNVKEALKIVSNCMLIGDKRKFLSMLLTLKVVIDPDSGEPSDVLTPEAVDWCKSKGSNATKVSDILDKKDAIVLKAIQEGIDQANKKAVSNATRVQKWSILPRDFSIPGGELGTDCQVQYILLSDAGDIILPSCLMYEIMISHFAKKKK
ncbi:hypothetical protein KUTeg_018559 [Tegillarca granosa]|uniref:long-chain-fatty-acid--CoA ligase n=1 Tax=Tegillarca granosa TaxID=220873 RepID=A0ABQ9EM67_TEGGR|nr:hypothetical protein KUTeg_018559 [Tegillarca granosa]